MTRSHRLSAVIATLLLPVLGEAQVLTPSRARVDTLTRLTPPAPLAIVAPTASVRIHLDGGRYTIRPGTEPALIIKDSAAHVLAMVAPGDSLHFRDALHPKLEPDMIAGVEVLHDTSLVRVLGRGFENGLLIINLTPGGTVAWQSAAVRKPTPP